MIEADPRDPPMMESHIDVGFYQRVEIPRRLFEMPCFLDLSDAGFRAQLNLIKSAWFAVPAGSLENHPRVLAQAAGFGSNVAEASPVIEECLAFWTECQDDRFYFPPMLAGVMEAFSRRVEKKSTDRVRQGRSRLRQSLVDLGATPGKVGPQLVALFDAWQTRGGPGLKGPARQQALLMLASDFELLPKEDRAVVRSDLQFTMRGGR